MIKPLFPDQSVEMRVDRLVEESKLHILKKTYNSKDDLQNPRRERGDERWVWLMGLPDTLITVSVEGYFPSYYFSLTIENASSEVKESFFFFEKYLSKYLKNQGDSERINKVIREESWRENWGAVLDVLEEHLAKDLGAVVRGEFWPDIPFCLEDYVEPGALDRLYQDQLKALEQSESKEQKGAWVYILDTFRKKK